MCGRAYATYTQTELYLNYLNRRAPRLAAEASPNYNLAPTQLASVVLVRDGASTIEPFLWGLVPFWAKDVASVRKYSLINARGEDIAEKRSFTQAFRHRRCVVPLSGFFEWKRQEFGAKQPFAIHLKQEPIMSVAGVWERWTSPGSGDVIHSFAIVTTAANAFMRTLHDRMPVILDKSDVAAWLDPERQETVDLQTFLRPCPSEWLTAFPVSTKVNSPRYNQPDVLVPTGPDLSG